MPATPYEIKGAHRIVSQPEFWTSESGRMASHIPRLPAQQAEEKASTMFRSGAAQTHGRKPSAECRLRHLVAACSQVDGAIRVAAPELITPYGASRYSQDMQMCDISVNVFVLLKPQALSYF
jgi:hypothetical protein